MKILSIDTSTTLASVSYYDGKEIYEENINNEITHSEKLLVLIDKVLKNNNCKISDIDLFACTTGPGSFTGIRISIASIKAFAQASNKKIYGRNTLDVLAFRKDLDSKYICSMLDAKNENVYYSLYSFENGFKNILTPSFGSVSQAISDIKNIVNIQEVTFVGNGVIENLERFSNLKTDLSYPLPSARKLIELVDLENDMLNNENIYSYHNFKPSYLRPSQAERSLCDK